MPTDSSKASGLEQSHTAPFARFGALLSYVSYSAHLVRTDTGSLGCGSFLIDVCSINYSQATLASRWGSLWVHSGRRECKLLCFQRLPDGVSDLINQQGSFSVSSNQPYARLVWRTSCSLVAHPSGLTSKMEW